jgi:hypothetical protein
VAQLVEALRYKSEGRGLDSRLVLLEFSIDIILLAALSSNINDYQEYFLRGKGGRCLGLTTLTPTCS